MPHFMHLLPAQLPSTLCQPRAPSRPHLHPPGSMGRCTAPPLVNPASAYDPVLSILKLILLPDPDTIADIQSAVYFVDRRSDNEKIKYHPHLRIHTDICVDIAVEENLIVYIQLLSAVSGLSKTHFLSLSQLPGATAEQIVTSLPEVFEKNKKKLIRTICVLLLLMETQL